MRLVLPFFFFSAATALTCYNGMKLLRMQGVGTSTTECPSGSYCYNMTASAYLVVDLVKAGCSTYRCMLARDSCISTYFQLIPVSLCCCSHDRCNVGGNPVYDSNPSAITGGSGGGSGADYNYGGGNSNNNQGGSGYDYNYGSNSNNNQNKGGSSFDQNYGSNSNNQNKGGSAYDHNYGSNSNIQRSEWGSSLAASPPRSGGSGNSGRQFSKQEIEDRFKNFDVDHKGDHGSNGDIEEAFERVDAFTTPPPRKSGLPRQGSTRGNADEISIP